MYLAWEGGLNEYCFTQVLAKIMVCVEQLKRKQFDDNYLF
jgi:hypothetical protein